MAKGARGIILSAPGTGQGKTTLMLGLLRALHARGHRVGALKIGPDFIDPGFHQIACGGISFNIDGWAMRRETRAALIAEAGEGADLVLAEGMMGLFDGVAAGAGVVSGSTADIAAETGWPVVLVIDASAQAQSIAPLAQGFARFGLGVNVVGVILTKAGGAAHQKLLGDALAAAGIRVFGMIGFDRDIVVPERHLGLVQAREQALESIIARIASSVAAGIDLDGLVEIAQPSALVAPAEQTVGISPLGQRIAVADDMAFAFAYPHVLSDWQAAGAELVAFAPLADEAPREDCDAVFLPGGYPELHAPQLASGGRFHRGMHAAVARGAAVYGECGGYMALGDAVIDARGRRHAMLGLLPLVTTFAEPKMRIGYRALALAADAPFGSRGERFRGHEFHFANVLSEEQGSPLFTVADADGTALGDAGLCRGRVAGSFLHLLDSE